MFQLQLDRLSNLIRIGHLQQWVRRLSWGFSAVVALGYCIFKRNREFRRAADNLQRAGENARDAAGTAARLANVFGQAWRAMTSARQNIQENVPNVREIPRPNLQGLGIGPAAAAATILTMPKRC